MSPPTDDIWIFGYGSLMWRPGFDYRERCPARIHGYHRALCVYSVHHRGTAARPGLVLGLDRGGACRGLAFRVAAARAEEVTAYLRRREMVTRVYVPTLLRAGLGDGRAVTAHTFIIDRGHRQYAGRRPLADAARLIAGGRGESGAGLDYLRQTVDHLRALGIADKSLAAVLARAEALAGKDG